MSDTEKRPSLFYEVWTRTPGYVVSVEKRQGIYGTKQPAMAEVKRWITQFKKDAKPATVLLKRVKYKPDRVFPDIETVFAQEV